MRDARLKHRITLPSLVKDATFARLRVTKYELKSRRVCNSVNLFN